jgi:hypothetical protein
LLDTRYWMLDGRRLHFASCLLYPVWDEKSWRT